MINEKPPKPARPVGDCPLCLAPNIKLYTCRHCKASCCFRCVFVKRCCGNVPEKYRHRGNKPSKRQFQGAIMLAPGKGRTTVDIDIDLSGLEKKWVAKITETPLCCVCDKPIGSDDHSEECLTATIFSVLCEEETPDCTCGAEDEPIILFKEDDSATLALTFHPECFGRRVKGCLRGGDLII